MSSENPQSLQKGTNSGHNADADRNRSPNHGSDKVKSQDGHEGHGHGGGPNHGHRSNGSHSHGAGESSLRRLGFAAAANAAFAVVQVVVGVIIGSVAVLADSLHQVVDAAGLLTALIALAMMRRPSSDKMTFGWLKADALGAYTSAIILLGSVVWVTIEAVRRLFEPAEVNGGAVVAIGVAGLVVNGVSVLVLGHTNHLSMRAARLHLLVDLFGSLIVVASGLVLLGSTLSAADPVASLAINLLVVRSTWRLLRASAGELLDGAPPELSVETVTETLMAQDGVDDVHHVHVRSLGASQSSVTAHIVLGGKLTLHQAQSDLKRIQAELENQLGDTHTTIQLECHQCEDTTH